MARKKEPVDEMLAGYQFPFHDGKTPYDYLTDKETGLRPGEKTPPSGFVRVNLSHGIDGLTLPPLGIWRLGVWGNEATSDLLQTFASASGVLEYESWIVPGEGTPTNYEYRVYTVPHEIAAHEAAKHPMLWSAALKKGKPHTWTQTQPQQKPSYSAGAKSYQQQATLPVGIRFRCPGCGHWWKESTLAPHSTSCCPGLNGGESDWAILCECCLTLDEVSQCKPGFPRKPKAKEVEKQEPKAVTAAST